MSVPQHNGPQRVVRLQFLTEASDALFQFFAGRSLGRLNDFEVWFLNLITEQDLHVVGSESQLLGESFRQLADGFLKQLVMRRGSAETANEECSLRTFDRRRVRSRLVPRING